MVTKPAEELAGRGLSRTRDERQAVVPSHTGEDLTRISLTEVSTKLVGVEEASVRVEVPHDPADTATYRMNEEIKKNRGVEGDIDHVS